MSNTPPVLEPLLTPDELADILSTSRDHVVSPATERRVPCVRVGRKIRFRPREIVAWLDDNTQPAIDD